MSRHPRRPLLRCRTLIGGASLGVLMLVALTLAGSFSAPNIRPPVPEAEVTKPIEPEMLTASQPRLKQTVLRPTDRPTGLYAYSTIGSPKATVWRCKGRPGSAACSPLSRIDAVSVAWREIQRATPNCKDFQAVLDDGTPVRVPPNACGLQLTLAGGGRVTNGFLTLRPAGHVPGLPDPRARLGACLGCGWL